MAKKINTQQIERKKAQVFVLAEQTQALIKRDIAAWRMAWQQAINKENPVRANLYGIYTDADVDLHLTGCWSQRRGMVMKKSFKIVDKEGTENPELTQSFEAPWFKNYMRLTLDSRRWGHSLIQLGDVVETEGRMIFSETTLVPRVHVIPEYGVVVRQVGDDWRQGYDYRNGPMAPWCVEAGDRYDLGLLLKCSNQTIPKKNMCAFWDQFGEIFGMPFRTAKTSSQDPGERSRISKMLSDMGAAAWGVFPDGTEIKIEESTKGDAFNVYDRRIDRCNTEISKGILGQTMTIDNGSSKSQGEVHLEVFQNIVDEDADFLRDNINYLLIPRMAALGFPVAGMRFDWDESIDYTPEQQLEIETMLADRFEIDPAYFIDKYNIPIIGKKAAPTPQSLVKPFFD